MHGRLDKGELVRLSPEDYDKLIPTMRLRWWREYDGDLILEQYHEWGEDDERDGLWVPVPVE